MPAITMDDPLFGPLTWDRIEHAWLGKARFDDLLDFGSALRDSPEGFINDSHDPQKLFKEGTFRLVVKATGNLSDQPAPTDDQREAWRKFLDRRPQIIGEMMDWALETYVRQRPARLYWWEKMYGADDPLLAESLPQIPTVAELRKVVRPYLFRVQPLYRDQPPPNRVAVQFDASWDRGTGIAALVRDGRIIATSDGKLADALPNEDPIVDVPPFGKLRCYKGTRYGGHVHFEPFARMQRLEADSTTTFRDHPVFRPAPDWTLVNGDFDFEMDTEKENAIAPEQTAEFEAFMANPQRSADIILSAIFEQYQQLFDHYRDGLDEEDADQMMPRITSPQALHELMTFQSMRVSTPAEGENAYIGLGFACSWDEEHGLYVRFRDGKVEEVGGVDAII